jgi:hypothetical protein
MVEHGKGSIAVTLGAEPWRDFPASIPFMLFSLLIHRAVAQGIHPLLP